MVLVIVPTLILLQGGFSIANCVHPRSLTNNFCRNPPLASNLSIPAYTGRWFQIYTSGTANGFSTNRCVTANYSQSTSGTISVLNCQQPSPTVRPQCIKGTAVPVSNAKLALTFFPGAPPSFYQVATLLGGENYGYFAAAVYSCVVTPVGPKEGFFILARAPYMPPLILDNIRKKIQCKGYQVVEPFVRTRFPKDCEFFDGLRGYDVVPPVRPSPLT